MSAFSLYILPSSCSGDAYLASAHRGESLAVTRQRSQTGRASVPVLVAPAVHWKPHVSVPTPDDIIDDWLDCDEAPGCRGEVGRPRALGAIFVCPSGSRAASDKTGPGASCGVSGVAGATSLSRSRAKPSGRQTVAPRN